MMGISFLADLQKYIDTCVHRLYDGIEDTIRIFLLYTLVGIPTDVHYFYRTRDRHYDHLFVQSFLNIDHHVFWHIPQPELTY